MNLWCHCFSQNANQKFREFLPYQTNKHRSQKKLPTLTKKSPPKKCCDPCLFGKAEILVIFGLHFGRNNDLINSFWIQLTFTMFCDMKGPFTVKLWPFNFLVSSLFMSSCHAPVPWNVERKQNGLNFSNPWPYAERNLLGVEALKA